MATLILRPTSATGTKWTNVTNVYDGDESTLGSVSVKSTNYSNRALTCTFSTSSLANVTSATLVVIVAQSSSTSAKRITVQANINGTNYISTQLTTHTSTNRLSADITDVIANASTIVITGVNTSTNSNTFRIYEVYIEVEYTEIKHTVTFKDTDDNILDTQTVNDGENASLTSIYKADKLITNFSEDYRNITSDRTIIVNYADIYGTTSDNVLKSMTTWGDITTNTKIDIKDYSAFIKTDSDESGIYQLFYSNLMDKNITISVSDISANSSIIIFNSTTSTIIESLYKGKESAVINIPYTSDTVIIMFQNNTAGYGYVTDLCAIVEDSNNTVPIYFNNILLDKILIGTTDIVKGYLGNEILFDTNNKE